jgi:hypothetical protein
LNSLWIDIQELEQKKDKDEDGWKSPPKLKKGKKLSS